MSVQKFGITTQKEDNFHNWYTQVVLRGELLDYYDIRGCFIMRPASMFMWSSIRSWFESRIQKMGIQECYFPMLVSKRNLEQEKDHLENFNPELAWITKCGEKDLEEPVAIRPTSETIMYPAFARWLSSYRELPLKLNQWCSVLRWEVKSTLPFIRGREFLWQEGHTAYYKKDEAEKETLEILDLYEQVYRDLLAVPVIKGKKSKKETFGGAEYTTSVEAFIPGTGKGIQGATSHHLGQNFSKMFDIKVDNENNLEAKSHVFQNCWGLTTRSIGVAVMVHSDNRGFVCPPRVAQIQAVVVLCGIKATTTDNEKIKLEEYAKHIIERIRSSNIRVHFDNRENLSPGFKFNHWELRGVPCRIEVGFKDMEKAEVCIVRRDNGEKIQVKSEQIVDQLNGIIDSIHSSLYIKAEAELKVRTKIASTFEEMLGYLNDRNIVLAPWCSAVECEDEIGEKTTVRENDEVTLMGAKSLCIPFEAPSFESKKCISCKADAKCFALFGRSY
ncbi:proline-tRNA ligase [Vittaforma corneae ATCC 50505]|uniref:proline--tRNA ligase n=1 Tax=Vittaforma corneae (strain ATCC 50505) TaxID=993615 RepID=L2GKL1_VITCO|nr:proline-tRNA ligase [Vittaforma corneae ATCC 50505]ELA41391.1 proline-tRNA ligase [Vittaforma corneae ATCC 50505]